jgi:hypothetical protein
MKSSAILGVSICVSSKEKTDGQPANSERFRVVTVADP